jgi:hypothetical protein
MMTAQETKRLQVCVQEITVLAMAGRDLRLMSLTRPKWGNLKAPKLRTSGNNPSNDWQSSSTNPMIRRLSLENGIGLFGVDSDFL